MAGGLNRNITVRLLADTSNFTAGMAKVSAEAEKTSTTMEASGGKTKLLTAGIAATALGVAAVRMAADFDAGMSTVQANTGASADEMSLLRQAAIDAGADTVYSATDAADAINELGKAGMSTSDILSGLLIAAISAIAAGLWHQLKNLRSQIADEETRRSEHEQLMADMRRGCEHEKLVDEALRTLLLCKLEQQQDTMVHDHHGVADNDFKLRAQRVYDAYHGLGGNGHGTQVNNDIQNAPIAPRLGGKPS